MRKGKKNWLTLPKMKSKPYPENRLTRDWAPIGFKIKACYEYVPKN